MFLGTRGGIASTVYGTVVVMATLTAAYASEKDPWRLAAIVSITALVLWIAHLYAHGLSESIAHDHRLTKRDLTSIAHRELGILMAAVLPCAALALGALGLLRERSAVWLATASRIQGSRPSSRRITAQSTAQHTNRGASRRPQVRLSF